MYRLKITSKAKRQLKKISQIRYQHALATAFEDIKEDPFLGKSLTRDLTGRFSYKVGVYRVIYKVNEKDKTVSILSAGHRASVYKR